MECRRPVAHWDVGVGDVVDAGAPIAAAAVAVVVVVKVVVDGMADVHETCDRNDAQHELVQIRSDADAWNSVEGPGEAGGVTESGVGDEKHGRVIVLEDFSTRIDALAYPARGLDSYRRTRAC